MKELKPSTVLQETNALLKQRKAKMQNQIDEQTHVKTEPKKRGRPKKTEVSKPRAKKSAEKAPQEKKEKPLELVLNGKKINIVETSDTIQITLTIEK